MKNFTYYRPKTADEAVGLLDAKWGTAELLAGGTDLLDLQKEYIAQPDKVISVNGIKELVGVFQTKAGVEIGAGTTLADIAANKELRKRFPALATAAGEAATPQIRNMATLGGNLCQRNRCWYYRSGLGLLPKDESGKDLVAAGENRYHAILGNDGPAKFVSPSTIVPILIAYGAKIRLAGPKGKRELPLEKFFVIPKSENEREHDLRPNEIVTEVVIPAASGVKAAHYEIRQKEAFDWPLAVTGVALKMRGSNVESARIVLGYVAPVPWPAPEAERFLAGKPIDKETAQKAAEAALANAKPLSQNAYKVKL